MKIKSISLCLILLFGALQLNASAKDNLKENDNLQEFEVAVNLAGKAITAFGYAKAWGKSFEYYSDEEVEEQVDKGYFQQMVENVIVGLTVTAVALGTIHGVKWAMTETENNDRASYRFDEGIERKELKGVVAFNIMAGAYGIITQYFWHKEKAKRDKQKKKKAK